MEFNTLISLLIVILILILLILIMIFYAICKGQESEKKKMQDEMKTTRLCTSIQPQSCDITTDHVISQTANENASPPVVASIYDHESNFSNDENLRNTDHSDQRIFENATTGDCNRTTEQEPCDDRGTDEIRSFCDIEKRIKIEKVALRAVVSENPIMESIAYGDPGCPDDQSSADTRRQMGLAPGTPTALPKHDIKRTYATDLPEPKISPRSNASTLTNEITLVLPEDPDQHITSTIATQSLDSEDHSTAALAAKLIQLLENLNLEYKNLGWKRAFNTRETFDKSLGENGEYDNIMRACLGIPIQNGHQQQVWAIGFDGGGNLPPLSGEILCEVCNERPFQEVCASSGRRICGMEACGMYMDSGSKAFVEP